MQLSQPLHYSETLKLRRSHYGALPSVITSSTSMANYVAIHYDPARRVTTDVEEQLRHDRRASMGRTRAASPISSLCTDNYADRIPGNQRCFVVLQSSTVRSNDMSSPIADGTDMDSSPASFHRPFINWDDAL